MIDLFDKIRDICSTRQVSLSELIKNESVPEEYLDNLNKLKKDTEYAILLNGSKLGLLAYLKPVSGIPFSDLSNEVQEMLVNKPEGITVVEISDLSNELQEIIRKFEQFIKTYKLPSGRYDLSKYFGEADYNSATNSIDFYPKGDVNHLKLLKSVILDKITLGNVWIDRSNTPTMKFYTKDVEFINGEPKAGAVPLVELDISDLIKDGMLDDVRVENVTIDEESIPCFKFIFNTSSGHADINIPLSTIFNINNYYTKSEVYNKTETYNKSEVYNKSETYTKEEVALQIQLNVPTTSLSIVDNDTNPVSGDAVYSALQELSLALSNAVNNLQTNINTKVTKPVNTVYVTLAYWNEHINKSTPTVFALPNTHYIIAENLYEDTQGRTKTASFGENCSLSAYPGCMLGACKIKLNNTFVDAGLQLIFRTHIPEHPCGGISGTINGTQVFGTFANARILPEWWGAKSGRGVKVNGKFANAETEAMALINAIAFNRALECAGNSEVYAPGPMYMIGATIYDNAAPALNNNIPSDTRDEVTSFTKLYVEGDLVASNEFIGVKLPSANDNHYWTELPTIVYVRGSIPRITVKGAIVVPFSALDKTIVKDSLPAELTETDLGKVYFVQIDNTDTYNVYAVYQHYTATTSSPTSLPTILSRHVGFYSTTSNILTNYANSDSVGGSNRKLPGMYGMYVAALGGEINVGRFLKGDVRAGLWGILNTGSTIHQGLMSYKYRKDVMHLGHCTALCLRSVNAMTFRIGDIEGFNDGIAHDCTHATENGYVQFSRFDVRSIACNHAVHIVVCTAQTSLVDKDLISSSRYFDGCRWYFGGYLPLATGAKTEMSSFVPTTAKSVYFLVEGAGDGHSGGFSNHWIEFDNSPLKWYATLFDLSEADDNRIIMHGGANGDTGRIVLWCRASQILSHYSNTLPQSYYDHFEYAPGEDSSTAWFPLDTFVGMGSLYDYSPPYVYPHIAALQSRTYSGSTSYGQQAWYHAKNYVWGSRLCPTSNETSADYSEWSYPYSNVRKYMNFRNHSHHNIVIGGKRHMLCYESVYNDNSSGSNEIHRTLSAYAMYEDNKGSHSKGHWGVINSYHPIYDIVRFDRTNDPADYGDHSSVAAGNQRRMMIPDENTLACLKVVQSTTGILDVGLYIVLNTAELATTAGVYKDTRYLLWEKYNLNSSVYLNSIGLASGDVLEQVGWISSIYVTTITYKEYSDGTEMANDSPLNGTIGYDAYNEEYYIYDSPNGEWRRLDNIVTESDITNWNGKLAALTFDPIPTTNSTNPVTSDGIKTYVDGKVSVPIVTLTPTNNVATLEANKYYLLGSVGSSTAANNVLTLSFTTSQTEALSYIGRFTAVADALSLSLPSGIHFTDNVPDIEAGHTYEFNILYDTCVLTDITYTA